MNKNRQRLALLLAHPNLSNREIARQRICSPTTIARLRSRVAVLGLTAGQLDAMSESDLQGWLYDRQLAPGDKIWPEWDTVLASLQAGDNRQEAYDAFVETCANGKPVAYRTFCKHLEPLLDAKNPTMRLLHKPGDKAMVDFAGYSPKGLLDGKEHTLQLFVARLPASGYGFAWITATQTMPDWLAANEAMFRFFGGTTNYLVSDNLRSAVTEHRRGKAPVLNTTFLKFADHFDTTLAPARPKRPKDKAAVEEFVKQVQRKLRRALRNRPLLTIAEMNELLVEIVIEVNKRAPRKAFGETRRELFERIDRPALNPLPGNPFVYFSEKQVKVPPNYHVNVEGIDYSVPHRLIACRVVVQTSRLAIEVFYDGQLVAMHQRSWERGTFVTDPAHMPPGHYAWRLKETADLELWAKDRGEAVRTIMAAEAALGHTGRVRDTQYELVERLARKYGSEAFEQACARACAVGDHSITHVRNLLASNRQGAAIRSKPVPRPNHPAKNVRGASYYAGEA